MKRTPLLLAAATLLVASSAYAALITQTSEVTGTPSWNTASVWGGTGGTGGAAPSIGNSYQTAVGVGASGTNVLGANFNGQLRDTGSTFTGDSLTIVSGTRLLLKQSNGAISNANMTLNGGGIINLAPNSGGTGTLAGTLAIAGTSAAPSVLGVTQGSAVTFTVSSSVTGDSSAVLRLAADSLASHNLIFNGDFSAYSGTLQVGGGNNLVTLNFDNATGSTFDLSHTTLAFGGFSTADKLNLTDNLTVGSLTFGANTLLAGDYTAAQLNSLYGNGSQFTGGGLLTVVPEPSSCALMGASVLAAGFVRRRKQTA